MKKNKCSVCPEADTKLYKVTYSTSPFGEDSDTVYLCDRHATEAGNQYDVQATRKQNTYYAN